MAGAWFIHRPLRPVWPVRGLYRPQATAYSERERELTKGGLERSLLAGMGNAL